MLSKLARVAVLFILAAMIAAWAISISKSSPTVPQNDQLVEHWYL